MSKNDRKPDPVYFGSSPPFALFGEEIKSGRQVYVAASLLNQHAHVMGGTGSHKTVFSIMLFVWLMRNLSSPMFFIDFGGSRCGLNRVKEEAKKSGRKLHVISSEPDHQTSWFNPFEPFWPLVIRYAERLTDFVVTALGLDSPSDGSEGYFALVNFSSFLIATRLLIEKEVTHPSFPDFEKALMDPAAKIRRNDAAASLLAIQQLSGASCMREGDLNDKVSFDSVIENNEIVYAFLPTLQSPVARSIGGLLLFSLLRAAMNRKSVRKLFVGLDEFQTIATTQSFSTLLTQSRKFGFCFAPFVNQSMDQLVAANRDLRATIFENTAVKLYLTPTSDFTIDAISTYSMDTLRELKGRNSSGDFGMMVSSQSREYVDRLHLRNDSLDAAFRRFHGILLVNDSNGHHEPIHLRFTPDVSIEEHERLEELPIPLVSDTAAPKSESRVPLTAPHRVKRHHAIRELVEQIDAEESYPPRNVGKEAGGSDGVL